MKVGVLPLEEPGVFRTLLLAETADALARREPVTALALTDGEMATGALAGYIQGERFVISSLFVSPEYRRRGGGRLLLESLEKVLAGEVFALELSAALAGPEEETLPPFLEKMGFEEETKESADGALYLITLGELVRQPFFAKGRRGLGTPVEEVDESVLSLAEKRAAAECNPLPPGGLQDPLVDQKVSVVWERNGRVEAYAAVDRAWAGGLTLSAVWSSGLDPTAAPRLLRTLAVRAARAYPMETRVLIPAVSDSSAKLVRALLPAAREISRTYVRDL